MHEHTWQAQSENSTSSGTVIYARCRCGAHAVSLRGGVEGLLAAVVVKRAVHQHPPVLNPPTLHPAVGDGRVSERRLKKPSP